MKIAVSATGGSIHAKLEERFGRAPYYVIVDSETTLMVKDRAFGHNPVAALHASYHRRRLIADRGREAVR